MSPDDYFPRFVRARCWLPLPACVLLLNAAATVSVRAQTLAVQNDIQTHVSLSSTAITVSGAAELRLTGTGDVLPGSTVNLTPPDAWLLFTKIRPSDVNDDFLSRIRVNGVSAGLTTNVRVVQYGQGTVVIPHDPAFRPLEAFDERYFRGTSWKLAPYTDYDTASLDERAARFSSFKLKRGYMATFAATDDGFSNSRCYIAQDGDLEIGRLPAGLDDSIRFVRVFPWRWVGKKGSCDVWPTDLKADWHYNWSIDRNSALDWEYAGIKQQPYWPGTNQDWKARGVNHLSGFNEPDNPVEDAWQNLTPQGSVSNAVARYNELVGTGLRVGAPAVTDGGTGWITSFMNQADAAGVRVDYVPVHYYRSQATNNPSAAASALYSFLKNIHDVAKRPIWVTEFNNGANWTDNAHDPTTTENRDVIEAMVEMMDAQPWIERYAIYSNVEWFRDTHYAEGGLTPMGSMYRDHVAPIGHRQERVDSGIGRTTRYRFDGTSFDDGGNGQDAIRVGTPSFVAGKYGQAVQLDGVNDYLQLPASTGDSADFTFAAWVYWSGGGNWQRIFDLGDLATHYLFLTTKAGSAGGTRFAITTNGGGGEQRLDAAIFPVNAWTHVAVTLSGNTGKLFINGTLADTNTSMTLDPEDVGVNYNYLGRSRFAADPNFNGRLDEVRFLTSALTEAQVAALATTAPPAFSAAAISSAPANVYEPYNAALAGFVTGGTGTLTFTKLDGPAWLRVSSAGVLTGTPGSADKGTNRFMVRVTDAAGGSHMAELTIEVQSAGDVPVDVVVSIASASNDAEEESIGTVTTGSTDLELVTDDAGGAGVQTVGLRFVLQVPPGALVTDARIQFTADESQSVPAVLTIATEASDNADAFTSAAGSLRARAVNPLTVAWQPPAWTAGEAGPAQQTPNLASLIEEVVLRPGWQMGNSIVFLINGSGHRTAEAFDKAGGTPARLTLTYYTPSPRFTVTSTINASAADAEESSAGAMDLDSTDLELVADGARGNQTVGLRFAPLAIPHDALIDYAAVQFAADEVHSAAAALSISAHAADNASAFTATAANLSGRTKTAAAVPWQPVPWTTISERGPLQLTPNLAPVVQEIVSRPGWVSGNALALLVTGTGQRAADAFDDTSAQPAALTVNYYTEVPRFTYARWAVDYPDLGTPEEDSDSDGYSNLLEYALAADPVTPGASPWMAGADANALWLDFQRPLRAHDLAYQVEWSDSLSGGWSSSGITLLVTGDDDTRRSIRAAVPAANGRRFLRIRVKVR
jgi:hypothetical protein